MHTNLGPIIVKLKILTTVKLGFARNLYSLLHWYPCLSPFACKVEIATFFFLRRLDLFTLHGMPESHVKALFFLSQFQPHHRSSVAYGLANRAVRYANKWSSC